MGNCAEYFENVMNSSMKAGRFAGANLLVLRDGKELHFGAYGYANLDNKTPMKRDSVFRLFSMSKPVTAVAVLQLVERGIIDLTDPVEKYLYGFAQTRVAILDENTRNGDARGCKYHIEPAKRSITIADLMNMTSGIAYPGIESPAHIEVGYCLDFWQNNLRNYDRPGTVDFMNALGKCPLAFHPGEHWMYGFSADVLGAVVEVASGRPLGSYLRDEIFTPLGMVNTGFVPLPGMKSRMTEAYESNPEHPGMLKPFTDLNLGLGDYPDKPLFESGGAGLLSTIDDYAKFAMMLANEGEFSGSRILSANSVRFMRSNQLTDEQKVTLNWDSLKGHGYGNLVRMLENPAAFHSIAPAGEFGWDGWMGTYVVIEPASKTVILFFRQLTGAGFDDITRLVRHIVYSM
ncbi:MAG: beta-lactamase family protein [Lachnospiraceae bacterium]|nr:beta-lactamase family protein [Lachnospiraceae bacterium]